MSTTDRLLDYLNNTGSVDSYFKDCKDSFFDMRTETYLSELLTSHNMRISDIAKNGEIAPHYIYEIFNGKKRASRNVLIQIAFGFPLDLKSTNRLLACGGVNPLYPRDVRDSVIIFCIDKGKSVYDCNELLYEKKMEPLWKDEEKNEPVTGK